jgi:hypothetical protein
MAVQAKNIALLKFLKQTLTAEYYELRCFHIFLGQITPMKFQHNRIGVISTLLATLLYHILVNKPLITLPSLHHIFEAGFAAAPNDLALDVRHIDSYGPTLQAHCSFVLIVDLGETVTSSSGFRWLGNVMGKTIFPSVGALLLGTNIKGAFVINLASSNVCRTTHGTDPSHLVGVNLG